MLLRALAWLLSKHPHLENIRKPQSFWRSISYQSFYSHEFKKQGVSLIRERLYSFLRGSYSSTRVQMSMGKDKSSPIPNTKGEALLRRLSFIVRKIERKVRMVREYFPQGLLV